MELKQNSDIPLADSCVYNGFEMVDQETVYIKKGSSEVANINSFLPNVNYSFLRGEAVVFVGAEKTGKTSFMHSWLISIRNRTILNVHLEMSAGQEIRRLIQVCHRLKVNNSTNTDEVRDRLKTISEHERHQLIFPFRHIFYYRKLSLIHI